MERLISLLGLFVMMGLAWLMSSDRRRVSLRVVVGGLVLQLLLALIILKTAPGKAFFLAVGGFITTLLGFVDAGTRFVFGSAFDTSSIALKVLPTIIFFSSLMSILYHFGILQRVIEGIAFVMRRTLTTSGTESLSAAANIFVGQTEAPLVIRPYLAAMTESELMAVMVGGFATVAGGVMAAYVGMGIDAGHLVTASVISAPAALLIAKIMVPESEIAESTETARVERGEETANVLHAITAGAATGVKLAINVGAMLIVFVALIHMVNYGIAGVFGEEWSLERALGYLFAPLAWVMGIEWPDALKVGQLLGIKTVANEFLAYERLAAWMAEGSDVELSERSRVIATYALCGFANFGSIGIQLGGIGPLAPDRQRDLARLGLRAMIGGTLAGFMTACVAGILIG